MAWWLRAFLFGEAGRDYLVDNWSQLRYSNRVQSRTDFAGHTLDEHDVTEQVDALAQRVMDLFMMLNTDRDVGHLACMLILTRGVALRSITRDQLHATIDDFIAAYKEANG